MSLAVSAPTREASYRWPLENTTLALVQLCSKWVLVMIYPSGENTTPVPQT